MNHGANVYCNKGNVFLSAVCLNDLLMFFFNYFGNIWRFWDQRNKSGSGYTGLIRFVRIVRNIAYDQTPFYILFRHS